MKYFNELETLNRGLDLAADTSDAGERNQQHHRNVKKAARLLPDEPLFVAARAVVSKRI